MNKIAFMGSVYRGHIEATRNLVSVLKAKGFDVHYFMPEKYKDVVESFKVTYSTYPNTESLHQYINLKLPTSDMDSRLLLLSSNLINTTKDMIDWGKNSLVEKQFDLIIHDNWAVWGRILSDILKIKSISSTTIMTFSKETIKQTGEGAVYLEVGDRVNNMFREFSKQYPNSPTKILDLITGEYAEHNILYTSRYIQRHSTYFDNNSYIFFPQRCNLESPLASKKLSYSKDFVRIYFSLGTLYNHNVSLFQKCFDAFSEKDCRIITSVGGNDSVFQELKKQTNEKVDILKFVNQNSHLLESDIFITHGGFNSIHESICALVPMIIIPQAGDQFMIAKQLSDIGVAVFVKQDNLKEDLSLAFNHIVTNWDHYQNNLIKARESLIDKQAINDSVERIENFMISSTITETAWQREL